MAEFWLFILVILFKIDKLHVGCGRERGRANLIIAIGDSLHACAHSEAGIRRRETKYGLLPVCRTMSGVVGMRHLLLSNALSLSLGPPRVIPCGEGF